LATCLRIAAAASTDSDGATLGLHFQVSKTKPPQLRPYSEDAVAKADKEARWKAQALRHVEADELRAIASATTQGPSALLQHVYQV
jgi:hypothetical protein